MLKGTIYTIIICQPTFRLHSVPGWRLYVQWSCGDSFLEMSGLQNLQYAVVFNLFNTQYFQYLFFRSFSSLPGRYFLLETCWFEIKPRLEPNVFLDADISKILNRHSSLDYFLMKLQCQTFLWYKHAESHAWWFLHSAGNGRMVFCFIVSVRQ